MKNTKIITDAIVRDMEHVHHTGGRSFFGGLTKPEVKRILIRMTPVDTIGMAIDHLTKSAEDEIN